MTKFRLVLVMLCIGLLGAAAIIAGLSKPDAANAQREAAVQPETVVQRQMAAQREAQNQPVRAQIGTPLLQARNLTLAGNYTKALAVIDGLQGIPNKTAHEATVIDQMRQYVLAKARGA